ncbi:hypothetical protein CC80DRAFT_534197 [Byssothecium circinans]|uniref:Uncharacterized protein n=1 Tax=Byssothecium circinans TaxID=147558 RepID=A0A6A5U651_9PLEO|nr:hypothetical protein CC80DRAFT_534197 [Byssothecium circinans]
MPKHPKSSDIAELATLIGELRKPNNPQPSQDEKLAEAWLNKLYAASNDGKRETEIWIEMAVETAKMTANELAVSKKVAPGEEELADNMDFHYTKVWMKKFTPGKKHWYAI